MKTKKQEYMECAIMVEGAGLSLAVLNPEFSLLLTDAAKKLREAGHTLCAQGYFGCYDDKCTSDHK